MKQYEFPLGARPAVTIRSHADLRLTGWDRAEASVDSGPGYSLKVDQDQSGLRITCLDDCEMYLPFATTVTIEKVSGDLHLSNLNGSVTIDKVSGSAVFYQTGALEIEKIDGDCDVNQVSGLFAVTKISGSLEGASFASGLAVEKAGGDIRVKGVRGDLTARAGGSISAVLAEDYGQRIQLRAGGDIDVRFPGKEDGHYLLSCGSQEMDIRLSGRSERVETGRYEFTVGEAARAEIEMRAGGSLELSSRPVSAEEASQRQEKRAEGVSDRQATARPAWGSPDWNGIARSTEETINRATRSAAESMRQAERRVEAALRGLERRSRPEDIIVPPAPQAPVSAASAEFVPADQIPETPEQAAPRASNVSDDERLLILKMLQEKKISVEEAEALMEALETPDQGE